MKKIVYILIILSAVWSCSSQKKETSYKNGETISVTGTLALAGNEPFTRMVLRPSDEKAALILPKSFREKNASIIGKTISASGRVEIKEKRSADHKYIVYEYYLIPESFKEEK